MEQVQSLFSVVCPVYLASCRFFFVCFRQESTLIL